jgi:hypothetical protein
MPSSDTRNVNALTAIAVTAPLISTGGSTPTLSISPASASTAGSMSIANFNKLAAATAVNTLNTIVLRDASGNVAFGAASATSFRWTSGAFTGTLSWTPTANRSIALPNDSGTVLLDDRPIGSLNSGVSVRGYRPIVTIGEIASKTLALSDAGTIQYFTSPTLNTQFLIPLNSAVAFPIGTEISFLRGVEFPSVTLAAVSGVLIYRENYALEVFGYLELNSFTTIRKIGTNTWSAMSQIPQNAYLGRPTVANNGAGTNDTTAANTAFVQTAIALANSFTSVLATDSTISTSTTTGSIKTTEVGIGGGRGTFSLATSYNDSTATSQINRSLYFNSGNTWVKRGDGSNVALSPLALAAPVAVSNVVTIPFDGVRTVLAQFNVTGAVAFTPATSRVRGAQTILVVSANGANIPTLGAGVRLFADSATYSNVAGTLHVYTFYELSGTVWVRISR